MDEYGFKYEVQPAAPPAGPPLKGPIPLVRWRDDPVQQELAKELEQAHGDEQKLNAFLSRLESLRVALPLRRYVKDGLAAFIAPYEYSYDELTRCIAQQCGSAHEDDAMEEGLAPMRYFRIGNDQSHIVTLISFADTILRAGSEFLAFMVATHGYQLQRFQFSSPTRSPSGHSSSHRLAHAWRTALAKVGRIAANIAKLPELLKRP
jgi:hypothetical protein